MNEAIRDQLIGYFQDELNHWDWESWQSAGAGDKEEVVASAIAELGINVDIDDAYELFWEWADGLEEEAFN
jgi:hypothetical protein